MIWPRAGLVVGAERAVGPGTATDGRAAARGIHLTAEVAGAERVVRSLRAFARLAETAYADAGLSC